MQSVEQNRLDREAVTVPGLDQGDPSSRIVSQVSSLEFTVMNAAEKGELYARIFRKVGVFLGKGEIPRALKELNEGMKIAERNGDSKMAARFAQEIAHVSQTNKPTK